MRDSSIEFALNAVRRETERLIAASLRNELSRTNLEGDENFKEGFYSCTDRVEQFFRNRETWWEGQRG